MAIDRPNKLPKYVQFKHGAYWHVRRNDAKIVWTRLGDSYAQMLQALAAMHDDGAITMAIVFDRYLKEVVSIQSLMTQRQRRWQIEALRTSFGQMRPEAITTQTVYRFHDEYSANAPVSANGLVIVLRRVFVKAIRWGYISINPAQGIEKNPERSRDRYITDEEYLLLVATVPAHVARAVELGYLTGQRISDLLSLRWSQVQPDGLHIKQSKTGAKLIIERSAELDALLERCRAGKVVGQTVLARDNGERFTYYNITNPFRDAVKLLQAQGKIGERLTFHDLRRKAGSDIDADSELLGHLDARTRNKVYRVKPRRVKPTR